MEDDKALAWLPSASRLQSASLRIAAGGDRTLRDLSDGGWR